MRGQEERVATTTTAKDSQGEVCEGERRGERGSASGQMVFISALLALAFEMSENSATKRRCRNYPGMAHTAGVYCLQSQLQWAL